MKRIWINEPIDRTLKRIPPSANALQSRRYGGYVQLYAAESPFGDEVRIGTYSDSRLLIATVQAALAVVREQRAR